MIRWCGNRGQAKAFSLRSSVRTFKLESRATSTMTLCQKLVSSTGKRQDSERVQENKKRLDDRRQGWVTSLCAAERSETEWQGTMLEQPGRSDLSAAHVAMLRRAPDGCPAIAVPVLRTIPAVTIAPERRLRPGPAAGKTDEAQQGADAHCRVRTGQVAGAVLLQGL